MKVWGYKRKEEDPGIEIATHESFDICLDEIRQLGLGSAQYLEFPGFGRYRQVSTMDAAWPNPSEIHYRKPSGSTSVNGCLIYENIGGLSEFICKRYLPQNNSRFDQLARAMQAGVSGAIGEFERQTLVNAPRYLRKVSGIHLHRRNRSLLGLNVVARELFDDYEACSDFIDGEMCYLLKEAFQRYPVLARSYTIQIRQYQIPRLEYLLPLDGFYSESRMSGHGGVLHFDGRQYTWRNRFREIAPKILERFDRKGMLFSLPGFDVMPALHLSAVAAIRIPGRQEAVSFLARVHKTIKPRHKVLRHPCFVRDSRTPVKLEKGISVISNVSAAMFLLEHTTGGIFLPTDRSAAFPLDQLGDKASWALLCVPGGKRT